MGPGQPWELEQGLHLGVAVPALREDKVTVTQWCVLLAAGPDALPAELVYDTAGVHT